MTRAINQNSLNNLRPLQPGYDPRRWKGGSRKHFRAQFAQEMYERHKSELEQVVAKVIQRALWGHDQSQRLCFDYFMTKPVFSEVAESGNDPDSILESMVKIPKEDLEDLRNSLIEKLRKAQEQEEESEEEDAGA